MVTMAAALPRIGTAAVLSWVYQAGACQPASWATVSIRSRAGSPLVVLETATSTPPPGRVTRGQLGEPGGGVGEVVKHERGDGVIDGLGGPRQRADIGHGPRWPGGGVPGRHAEGQVHGDGPGGLGG